MLTVDERFIVFELDNIKDHPILFAVVTIVIMEVFISKLRKVEGHKMILIEEAWKAIAREGMAEYIQYLFKTVRKHFGEAIVVTQEVEDSKPGYGFIDSVKYNHQKGSDTLTDIFLIEELPFSYQLGSVTYANSLISYLGGYSYQSSDSFMVSTYFCFSKVPEVSLKNSLLLLSTGLQVNVAYLNEGWAGRITFSFKSFTDAGFKEGDQIYVTAIPSILKFATFYFTKNRNYEILHYKVQNASNISSFTLR